jgi:hypothetical protein
MTSPAFTTPSCLQLLPSSSSSLSIPSHPVSKSPPPPLPPAALQSSALRVPNLLLFLRHLACIHLVQAQHGKGGLGGKDALGWVPAENRRDVERVLELAELASTRWDVACTAFLSPAVVADSLAALSPRNDVVGGVRVCAHAGCGLWELKPWLAYRRCACLSAVMPRQRGSGKSSAYPRPGFDHLAPRPAGTTKHTPHMHTATHTPHMHTTTHTPHMHTTTHTPHMHTTTHTPHLHMTTLLPHTHTCTSDSWLVHMHTHTHIHTHTRTHTVTSMQHKHRMHIRGSLHDRKQMCSSDLLEWQ